MNARGRPARQAGMALIMVLGALAVIATVAASFSIRMDALRGNALTLQLHAEERLQTRSALAKTLYFMATRPLGVAGFGPALLPQLWGDGRPYTFADGVSLRLQDQRGLYPINVPERKTLLPLLHAVGYGVAESDAMVDVLEDYLDEDALKRLNGAEAGDYATQGLPPPRNDWLVNLRELDRMPRWREDPERLARLRDWLSLGRRAQINPNTAPMSLLAALMPLAPPESLAALRSLREQSPFLNGDDAQRATGLPLAGDEYLFHMGTAYRITLSHRRPSSTLQYNVTLTPAGRDLPWLITDVQPTSPPKEDETRDRSDRAQPFPLAEPPRSAP